MEFVKEIKGVNYINDSGATNVNATWFAMECTETPLIWIAGGQDKGNDYSILFPLMENVKFIIGLGIDNRNIHKQLSSRVKMIINVASMKEAVSIAYRMSQPGDTVLLSPSCASFDRFDNYEDRGRKFKTAVKYY